MLNKLTVTAARRIFLRLSFKCVLTCLLVVPCHAQRAATDAKQPDGGARVQVSVADALSLTAKIKTVESPAFRAYLYAHVASWLWQTSGQDQALRRTAVEAAAAGVSDIHQHARAIPAAPASVFYKKLLSLVHQHDPKEAERLRQAYPLSEPPPTAEAKATNSFYSALAELTDRKTLTEGAEQASQLIRSGSVPASVLQGELARLDQMASPALPQVLDATLALEEQRPGALPLQTLFFLSHIYLKEATPVVLQTRFVAAAFRATRLDAAEVRGNPLALSWAVKLLQRSLPVMQKLSPNLYAEASAQLASLAPGAPSENAVYTRIKNSSDPLGQTITEADAASDERLKRELLESAARLARQQGKLRQAAEIIALTEEDAREFPEGYSPRDEFLDEVVEESLSQKDVETARYAASQMRLAVNRVGVLRKIGLYEAKAGDAQAALETLDEAAKLLKDAPEGKEKAVSYLRLATDFAELDLARASDVLREAVKAANNIPRPREDAGGEFSWGLFPLADVTIKTFQTLAQKDRAGALSLADAFEPKELKIAASLGAYSSIRK